MHHTQPTLGRRLCHVARVTVLVLRGGGVFYFCVVCLFALFFALGCGGGGVLQNGNTALHLASENGQSGTVELLLKHKAYIDATTKVTSCSCCCATLVTVVV